MGMYTNISCSKCKHSFTGGYSRLGLDSNLGLPILQCPNCGQLYKTRKKPWSRMTKLDKITLIINRFVQGIINMLIPLFIIIMLGHYVFKIKEDDLFSSPNLAVLIFLSFLTSEVFIYFNTKKYIKNTEEALQKKDYSTFFR